LECDEALARRLLPRGGAFDPLHIHFVGVGGSGMSAIAVMLLARGHSISGSDLASSRVMRSLEEMGARIEVGHARVNVPAETDLVVASAAIRADNAEVAEARRRGVRVAKYAEALGLMMRGTFGIAVSGTHGKTTTTGTIATVLVRAGRDPSVVVGGTVPDIGGSSRLGASDLLVVEACEYDRSFHRLRPWIAVINNIDRDHLDCFADLDEIVQAFGIFAARVPAEGQVLVNADDARACAAARAAKRNVLGFGTGRGAYWRLANWRRVPGAAACPGRTVLEVEEAGRGLGEFAYWPPGFHNALNALAAIGVCRLLGLSVEEIRGGLASYRGADRRFQLLCRAQETTIVDDYAHHPTEVRATLEAARQEFGKRRIWCVFQPHQYSRTRLLFEGFAHAFGAADRVVLADIFAARDSEEDRGKVNSAMLAERLRRSGVKVEYVPAFEEIVEHLCLMLAPGDVVLTMGAGPVDTVTRELAARLRPGGGVVLQSGASDASSVSRPRADSAA